MTIEFAQAYDEYVWDVYAFLAYRLGGRSEAEDLTQLTFERALRSWSQFDERRASLKTWLIAIARNALIDHYRRDSRAKVEPLQHEWQEPASEEDEMGLAPELHVALDRLAEREREVIALRFGGDLTGPEIADLLGLSLANVQQLLSRSLRKLRVDLQGARGETSGTR